GLTAQLVRDAVRLLGSREVASSTADLTDLVVAERRDRAVEVVELLAGRQRLGLRGRPVAAETKHLGPVDAARAGEPAHVELVAEAVRRLGPFGGAADVAQVLAGADRDAVDKTRRVGAEVAAHRGRRRLVEEREPLVDLPALDQG